MEKTKDRTLPSRPDSAQTAGKPTLKTIARLSGLAVPTVSRALNDAPDIGAETKRTVRRIAAEIGYVPNRAGVRLRTGRTNVIALVMSTEHDMMNHTARLISSIAGSLLGTAFHLNMTPYLPGEDPMRPIRYVVETRSADAVIFNQTEPDDPRIAYLMEQGFPFATHGRSRWAADHAWYDYDNGAFARIGVETLARKGRRNLLLIAPPLTQNYAQDMVRCARLAAGTAAVHLSVAQGITSDSANVDIRAHVARAVVADPTIDGIIAASTNATMAAVAGMEGEGFDVGADIDIFAKEAIPFLTFFRERILVVHEDIKTAGEFLARAAMQRVRDPDLPPMQCLEVPEAI